MAQESKDERDERASDFPADLTRERESFVRQFLRRGVELTESLLEENKLLHTQISDLRDQVTRLRSQVASDDAIRDLLRKIEVLEGERSSLLERSTELEEVTRETQSHSQEVEQELHDLANLYIASSHLHSTLSVRGVLLHIKELLQQLVGAEIFAIYVLSSDRTRALAIGVEGSSEAGIPPVVPGEGLMGEVLMTGVPRIAGSVQPPGTLEAPVAAIPLSVRDTIVGAISIAAVYEQKQVWAAVDHELFSLIGSHAATALIAANLYANTDGALAALDGLRAHLNPSRN